MQNKNIIIITIDGNITPVESLLSDSRNYDIAVIDFQSKENESPARSLDVEYVFESNGGYKYKNIKLLIERFPDLLTKYERFWMVDWDLEFTQKDANKFFLLANAHGFDLCQPSLSHDSYISWEITKNVKISKARITDFVEIMCPMFKKDTLKSLLWTFDLNYSGWGLDFLWATELKKKKIGIIDEVIIKHGKPISSHTWELPGGVKARDEFNVLIEERKIPLLTNTIKVLY